MQIDNHSKESKKEMFFLFCSIMLGLFIVFKLVFLDAVTTDIFRDYVFLREIFNGKILLHGAASGMSNTFHGVLGYWLLYPFILVKNYTLVKTLISIVNISVLFFFLIWGSRKFSWIFSSFCLLYCAYFFVPSIVSPYHLASTIFFSFLLFYFLILNNLFGVFICNFFLFQLNIIYSLLFIPLLFICFKQKNYKYFYLTLSFTSYFFVYILRNQYTKIINLDSSLIAVSANKIPYTSDVILNIILLYVLPLFCLYLCKLQEKKNKKDNNFLFDYFLVLLLSHSIIPIFLNDEINRLIIPASILVGYTAHLIYQHANTPKLLKFLIITGIVFMFITFGFVLTRYNFSFYTPSMLFHRQNLNIPVKYFLDNTFVKKNDKFEIRNCERELYESGIYEILISLEFNNQNEKIKNKYFLINDSEFQEDITSKILLKKVKGFENNYTLYSVSLNQFKQSKLDSSYMPIRFCLRLSSPKYHFYNFRHRKIEKISLLESYLHFNGFEK